KPMKPAAEEPDDKPAPRPAGPAIAVQTVVPKDATDLTLKTLVQHLNFKHPSSVPVLASSLSKHLAEQGWTKKGADLVTPKSAILNRSQGAAELTIFIKPDGTGATVSMMTKGLSWEAAK
ncbi:MAG TPA: hypothetical protein VL096_11465, partial [Pirellulaceae bacterium]|nr:hypothetical protein [Pirellulaceae bacterium]